MRDIFKFEKGYWYPHMSKADRAIWERFLDKYPDAFNSCQYDFHVGSPPPFDTTMDNGEDWNQDMLYRRRIDVVGHADGEIVLIEVKPRAGLSTIGQIKGYHMLYVRDEEPASVPKMMILTDSVDHDLEDFAAKENIKILVV